MARDDLKALAQRLPEDLTSNEAIRALIDDPKSTTAAMIAAALASGRKEFILAGGRIVQAALKGRAFKQFGEELADLLTRGKIRKDYAETKYGFQSLTELLTMIDSELPDEDKLRAAKAMFIAVNSPNLTDGESTLRYQLNRIVLQLTGSQLLLLGVCHKLYKNRGVFSGMAATSTNWLIEVGKCAGHSVLSLIERDEAALADHHILVARIDPLNVRLENARLTDLGLRICELIENYSTETQAAATQAR